MKDLYEVLEVDKKATQEEIKIAYKRLVKLYHPDLVKGKEEQFKEVKKAYDVLSDDKRRKTYDETGRTEEITDEVKKTYFRTVFDELILTVITDNDFITLSDVIGELNKVLMRMKEKRKEVVKKTKRLNRFKNRIIKKKGSKPEFFYENFIFKIEEYKQIENKLEIEIEMFSELVEEIHKNHNFDFAYQDEDSNAHKSIMLGR